MIRLVLSATAGVALLLAGCAAPATQQAVRPATAADLGLIATAPLVASDWWRSFGDPQLDRLVGAALDGNPGLDMAAARIAQARAVLATRRADDGPTVTLDAQGQVARLSGRYTIPPPFAGSTRFAGTALANIDWNLDLFGRQRAAIRGAQATAAAAALDLAAARLALAGSVVSTYLDLVRAEEQAAIARRTIDARTGSLRLVDVRVRNRLASGLDRQAATTLVVQARQALVRASAAATLAKVALAALAGRGPDFPAGIAPTRLSLDAGIAVPASVPADLLARRADIAAAQARIAAAEAGRLVARRAWYPNVNLVAMAGLQAIGIGNFLNLDAGTAGAGPALHLPLFDGGRRRADLAGAVAAVDLATADYNDRVVGAVREVAEAIARTTALAADRAVQAQVVRGFRETGRLNGIRVASGLDSRLDLVDNDIRALAAEQDAADLAADAAQARVRLAVALGGGFDAAQEPAR